MNSASESRRRYTRVQLADLGAVSSLLGVKVKWPQGETTRVLDLSYAGAALERPRQSLSNGEVLGLQFMHDETQLSVNAKVIWFNDRLVGCQFVNLPIESRTQMDRLLSVPIVGANLKPVDQKYFAAQDDFQFWYAGPQDCHVFLWTSRGTSSPSLNKALIQLAENSFVFEHGRLQRAGKSASAQDIKEVIQLLSQIHNPEAPLVKLLDQLAKLL